MRSQKGTENITWEIIVVDNNSNDQTANIIQEIITSWHELFPLRYIFEKQQGIAFARQRGIEESQGELVAFIDDDNFPDENWVLQAYLFAKEHPKAGSYGGQIHANYQVEPPQNFKRVEHLLLAIRESGDQPFLFCPERLQLPCGAGLVVRKKAWLDHVPSQLMNIGRGGNDYEISLHLYQGGWEIWYNPKMHLDHYIPSKRLDKKYLLSLASLYGSKSCEFRMLITSTWEKPLVFFKVMFGGIKRSIKHQIQHSKDIKIDLAAACELEFFRASAISPFYFLKKAIFKKS
ncbi:Glycosyl transferase [Planktothrix tepida PCC 9214]|uniref:Glycosyl transferase n=1 Tax=Planktothrix tepida PCC 9214 TaxID=671072 RepID=A0A1J1LGR1_9CYAN|nr:Glycosyl transferase [Planktothrix tepida PCC 9214]